MALRIPGWHYFCFMAAQRVNIRARQLSTRSRAVSPVTFNHGRRRAPWPLSLVFFALGTGWSCGRRPFIGSTPCPAPPFPFSTPRGARFFAPPRPPPLLLGNSHLCACEGRRRPPPPPHVLTHVCAAARGQRQRPFASCMCVRCFFRFVPTPARPPLSLAHCRARAVLLRPAEGKPRAAAAAAAVELSSHCSLCPSKIAGSFKCFNIQCSSTQ